MIDYIIDGLNIRETYGIYVEESTGIVDVPEIKERTSTDWAEYHGEVIDTSRPIFKAKTISLKCGMKCTNAVELVNTTRALTDMLTQPGFRRLDIALSNATHLYYDVILNGAISFTKKWRDTDFSAEFTITLEEPEPMKKVLKFTAADDAMTANLYTTSTKSMAVHWGDGSISNDVLDNANAISHTYEKTGDYIIVIHGDIDDMTLNDSNCTTLWNKLL